MAAACIMEKFYMIRFFSNCGVIGSKYRHKDKYVAKQSLPNKIIRHTLEKRYLTCSETGRNCKLELVKHKHITQLIVVIIKEITHITPSYILNKILDVSISHTQSNYLS